MANRYERGKTRALSTEVYDTTFCRTGRAIFHQNAQGTLEKMFETTNRVIGCVKMKFLLRLKKKMRRTYILLEDSRIPLTPIDPCWAIDGRVYVKFAQCALEEETRLVGRLEDVTIAGRCQVDIAATHGHRVPAYVHPSHFQINSNSIS